MSDRRSDDGAPLYWLAYRQLVAFVRADGCLTPELGFVGGFPLRMAEMGVEPVKEAAPPVMCRRCNLAMTVTDCHQIYFTGCLVQVMYQCSRCGIETTVMREDLDL
jgi:hypothetical protein